MIYAYAFCSENLPLYISWNSSYLCKSFYILAISLSDGRAITLSMYACMRAQALMGNYIFIYNSSIRVWASAMSLFSEGKFIITDRDYCEYNYIACAHEQVGPHNYLLITYIS